MRKITFNQIAYLFATFFFVVALMACSTKTVKEENERREIKDIFIELRGKITPKAEDVFKDIRYIPLETVNNTVLLNYGAAKGIKVLYRNNQVYYADYYSINIFDTNGKHIREINHRGDSPTDYSQLGRLDVFDNGNVLISSVNQHLLLYSSDDTFIIRYKNDLFIRDMACINDSLFVVKRNFGNHDARFLIFNVNGYQLVSKYTPSKLRKFGSGLGEGFVRYAGKLIVHESQNSNIYEITPDSLMLRYAINIDNRIPPEGFWEQTDREPLSLRDEREQKGYVDNITFFSESDHSLLFYYSGGDTAPRGYAFVDKQSMQYSLFDAIEFAPGFSWEPKLLFAQADGLVFIPIPADVICSLPETNNLRKQFPDLQEEDNPVLFIGTLK